MAAKHIIIAVSARGITRLDQLTVGDIILDGHAKRLIENRARNDGVTFADALEMTLTEAIREHVDKGKTK